MKPWRTHDFGIGAWPATSDHPPPQNRHYEGIYSVTLNETIHIEFVPAIDRHAPWPPVLPGDVDLVESTAEARRLTLTLARYTVTPDRERAGSTEKLDGKDADGVVFYVLPEEFDELSRDLYAVEDDAPGIHSSIPVSRLADTALARFLLERLIPSGYLSDRELYMIERSR